MTFCICSCIYYFTPTIKFNTVSNTTIFTSQTLSWLMIFKKLNYFSKNSAYRTLFILIKILIFNTLSVN